MKDFIMIDGKDTYIYTIKNGRYYVQPSVYCEKYGYQIPWSRKRISKESYRVMYETYGKEQPHDTAGTIR